MSKNVTFKQKPSIFLTPNTFEQKKILVIGQGLAGSLLAWHLYKAGQKITLIDHPSQKAASLAAAGIINPITGKRIAKTNSYELYFEYAKTFYQNLEKELGRSFFFLRSIQRIFKNKKEKEIVNRKIHELEYYSFIKDVKTDNFNICGGALLWIPELLKTLKDYLAKKTSFIEAPFNYKSLNPNNITFQNYHFDKIIFCEGYRALCNPWFTELPLNPAKGETLVLSHPNYFLNHIINRGHWLLQFPDKSFRLGATYSWDPLDECTTSEARISLLKSLPNLINNLKKTFQYEKSLAGVRPTTKNHEPLLLQHPKHSKLFLFNGFGSKGALLIPYYCQKMLGKLSIPTTNRNE